MNDDKYHVKKNELVYLDSVFGGLIKAKYIGKLDDKIQVKITGRKCIYDPGKILLMCPLWVIPRVLYRKTGLFRYIVTRDYTFDN